MSPYKIDRSESFFANQDKLLQLIDEGDPSSILSEEYLKGFNELMKYELITFENDKVSLTNLGREAQKVGVLQVLHQLKTPAPVVELPQISVPIFSRNRNKDMAKFFICSLILLVFFILQFTF